MHPFVHPFIVFWLYTALKCRRSMSSNSLVFHTSRGISSSPVAFLFLIFLSTQSSSSCVHRPSLMPNSLPIIFMISSCVTFVGFLSKFSKCYFFRCILLPSFTVCHAIFDCLSSTKSLILLIWFCMYSVCSFRHMLTDSFCAFLSLWASILVGFLL